MGKDGINSPGGGVQVGKGKEYVFFETGRRVKGWRVMQESPRRREGSQGSAY